MVVLDASAALAYLQGEPGAQQVRDALESGAVMGAANWAEVAQKLRRADSWHVARALLLSFPLQIASVTVDDAEAAAALWQEGSALSLGDRLCLALARRLDLPVLTADQAWSGIERVVLVR